MIPRSRVSCAAVLGALLVAPALAAQGGAFIVRRGTDTLLVEQYRRSATALEGDQMLRSARVTTVRHFTAALDRRGGVVRYELAGRRAADPAAPPQTLRVDFVGDTAIIELVIGDSSRSERLFIPGGAMPFVSHSYALLELVTRQAAASRRDPYVAPLLSLSSLAPVAATVARGSGDSLVVAIGDGGPLRIRADSTGNILGARSTAPTERITVERVAAVDVAAIARAFANRPLAGNLPERGTFIVRLGRDTVALERYSRTAARLEGEQVARAPSTVHRIYTATFGPGGAVERFELVEHNVSGAPGPGETKATVEFAGDTAISTLPDGDSTLHQRVKVPPGTLPWYFQNYALLEEIARRARAAGGASYTTTLLPLGNTEPWTVTLDPIGHDSMTILLGTIGLLRARVDERGTLLGLSGLGTTMQVTVERVRGALDFAALGKSYAPRSLGPLSPADSVRTSVAGAALAVRYSRPSMRGRVIFGNAVPWNKVWRTGANAATVLETSADLLVAGTTVPAGKYSLWTIPSPDRWQLILNRNTGQWGTQYDAQYDFARVDMTVERLPHPVEQFTIAIAPRRDGRGGALQLEWENTRASVSFAKK